MHLSAGDRRSESLDLAAIWLVLVRRRGFMTLVMVFSLILGLTLAFTLPPTYRAGVVILAPVENDPFGSLISARRALSSFSAFGLLSQTYTAADEYQAILRSETIQRTLVDRFHLQEVYKVKNMDAAVRMLRHHVRINLNADGTIAVQVEDRDRERVAALAQAFPEELEKFNQARRIRRAQEQLDFIGAQVDSSGARLRRSERRLQAFAERAHTPILSEQDKATAEAAAALLARRVSLEVKQKLLSTYMETGSDEVQQTASEISSINQQLTKLPSLQMEGARLLRDTRVEEELVTLMMAQQEQSRVRLGFSVATVELLDRAHPPDRRSAPTRSLVVIGCLFAGFLTALAGSLILEARSAPGLDRIPNR